jgi:folate-binding protein YgfZ
MVGERSMASGGYVLLPGRGVLALAGADTRPFLQSLISNDVGKVTPERAIYAALLTPQGKYLFDFMLVQDGERLLLESESERLQQLERRFLMYRFRSKVEIEDVSDRYACVALWGETIMADLGLPQRAGAARRFEGGVAYVDPRLVALGVRALLPTDGVTMTLTGLGLEPLSAEDYDRSRLALGVPDGSRDLKVERSTLLESGFEELNGVDFAKGCFVGQELTARMKYRGLVRKRLMPVRFQGPSPEPGTVIRLNERDAGEMRSAVDGRGLAMLRLEHVGQARTEGVALRAGETEVVPEKPDWANF